MATDSHFYNSTMSQFPQPARPFDTPEPDTCTGSRINGNEVPYHFPEDCDYDSQQYSSRASEGEDTVEFDDDLLQILREFAEEYDGKGRQILNKFFSKLENNVPLDHGIIREKLEEFRGKVPHLFEKLSKKMNRNGVNHPVIVQRGVNCDPNSADEEQELKLERFKVRTVKLGGVVKVVKNYKSLSNRKHLNLAHHFLSSQ